MTPTLAARIRIGLVLVAAIVVQTTVGADLRVDGVAPDLMLLLAIAGGLVGGPEAGAVIGFCAGLLADATLTTTPMGLCAFSWCVVGWAVGALRAGVLPEGRAIQPVIGFLATAGGVAVFLVAGDLAGQSLLIEPGRSYLLRVAVIEGLWSAVLIVPVTALLARAALGSKGADRLGRSDALAGP